MFIYCVLGLSGAGMLKPLVRGKSKRKGQRTINSLVTCVKGGFHASLVLGVKIVLIVWLADKALSCRLLPLLCEPMVGLFAVR